MPVELTVNTCGHEAVLALPIGGLADVAKHNPRLALLFELFQWVPPAMPRCTLLDLQVVLTAGLKWGKSDLKADEIIGHSGVLGAAAMCGELMALAMISEDARKKKSVEMPFPDPIDSISET